MFFDTNETSRHKDGEAIAAKLSASSLFDAERYLDRYPDVRKSKIDPCLHFAKYGALEGRQPWTTDQLLDFLRRTVPGGDDAGRYHQKVRTRKPPTPADFTNGKMALYASTKGNFFFADIRDYFASGLREMGVRVECCDELSPASEKTAHHAFLSPHEFFTLGEGTQWSESSIIANSIMLSTEQPTTPWFSISLHFLWRCRGVLEMNYLNTFILHDLGIKAHFLPLGYIPGHEWFSAETTGKIAAAAGFSRQTDEAPKSTGHPLTERPIDLLFVGEMTRRREVFFAKNAGIFSKYHTYVSLPTHFKPWVRNEGQALSTVETAALSRTAKVHLNIHRGDFPYFEWHRMVMLGVAQRTPVLTEPCLPVPGFQSGTHYIEADLEQMPERAEWLLGSVEGKRMAEVVAGQAFEAFREQFGWPSHLESLLHSMLAEGAHGD